MPNETEHPDAAQDIAQFRPVIEGLVKALHLIANKVDHIEGRHNALEKLVTEDLIGGIHEMYKTKVKNDRIGALKTKYGAELQPHFDALQHVMPGVDHWSHLHDHTQGLEGDALDSHIHELSKGLGETLGKIRGTGGVPVEAKPIAEEHVTVAEVKPKEGEKPKAAEEKKPEAKKPEEKMKEESNLDEPPAKKSKDELIAEKMKESKSFKLR
jgi:hypothetical protein